MSTVQHARLDQRGRLGLLLGHQGGTVSLVGADGKASFPAVILNGHPVNAIIGDGVARRHYQMGHGQRFDVVLANWSFPITDDKYLTYCAVDSAMDRLAPFNVHRLKYWQAQTVDELAEICADQRAKGDLIIKPFQGSGGAGVHPIDQRSPIPVIIEESMGEYRQKFGAWRSPFPYTVCEKIEPHRAWWRDSERNYDVRVYVARDGDQVLHFDESLAQLAEMNPGLEQVGFGGHLCFEESLRLVHMSLGRGDGVERDLLVSLGQRKSMIGLDRLELHCFGGPDMVVSGGSGSIVGCPLAIVGHAAIEDGLLQLELLLLLLAGACLVNAESVGKLPLRSELST